jgi:hypothetical protein
MAHTASRYSATGDDRVPSFVSVIPSMSDDSRRRLMMGRRQVGQGQFFYSFDLDKVVPPDHLVRQIDTVLDLSWVHKKLAPYYSHTGRPSIDPVLMIRMLIMGYVFAIGPVAELVGIEGGVVSGVFNLESSGVGAPDRRPRHEEHYHEA